MKKLYTYIQKDVNEGLIKNAISLAGINKMTPEQLLNGILNMYDYICDEDDIDLFFDEYPTAEKVVWKNIYALYEKKVWSMFDATYFNNANDESSNIISDLDLQENQMTKITPELRRDLRKVIKESRNDKLDLKPSEIDQVLPLYDNKYDKVYFITLNRTKGFFKKLFRKADINFLEKAFIKMADVVQTGKIELFGKD